MANRPALPWFWPFTAAAEAAATLAGEMGRLLEPPPRPDLPWATDNHVALDLSTVRLRDFSRPGATGRPVLIDAPFAVHTAVVADVAPGHSLVAALLGAGLGRVLVTDWKSASPAMRDSGIDSYLSDLNILIDDLGPPVDLIGLCQGGWLALVYAARFPHKVGALVLVGAPIDTRRGQSALATQARSTPMSAFRDLVAMNGGLMPGRLLQQRWPAGERQAEVARACLQLPPDGDPVLLERFARWDAVVVDLPGRYFLETVEWLFQENRLATGRFQALGRAIDLRTVRQPLFLLAGEADDVAPPPQVLAAAELVGTPPAQVVTRLAPAGHLALFMGRDTLATAWAEVAAWLRAQDGRAGERLAAPATRQSARRRSASPRRSGGAAAP